MPNSYAKSYAMRIFFGTTWQFPTTEKTLFRHFKLHREYIPAVCDKVTEIFNKCRGFVTVCNDHQRGYLSETQFK